MARHQIKATVLAGRIGRNLQWLSRRLTGQVSPTLEDLELICSGLDLDLAHILAAAGPTPESVPAA